MQDLEKRLATIEKKVEAIIEYWKFNCVNGGKEWIKRFGLEDHGYLSLREFVEKVMFVEKFMDKYKRNGEC